MPVKPLQLLSTFDPTHETAGLPGFPAIDLFAPAWTPVLAPEDGTVEGVHLIQWDLSKRIGGWTVYFVSADKKRTYYLAHWATVTHIKHRKKGELLGQVSPVPHNWWESHIHEGLHQGYYHYRGAIQAPPAPFSISHRPSH